MSIEERTAATWAGSTTVGEESVEAPVLPDTYVIHGVLGRGGMGVVYLVTDTVLNRQVAVKVLQRRHLDDAEMVQRFHSESRVMAALDHPGVVAVYANGRSGRLPWYAMRVVRGLTLRERTRAKDASLDALLAALVSTCRTMAYVHTQQVIHCDLKPENVVIGPFGEVQVLDWGIAEYAGAPNRTGVLGTRRYCAPEQASPPHVATTASDVFALGRMLQDVLSSEHPHPLDTLARDCTDSNPERRPTAANLADALQAWLDGATARRQALRVLARTRALAERTEQSRQSAEAVRERAHKELSSLASGCAPALKYDAWAQLDRADELDVARAEAEAQVLRGLHTALELCPSLAEAHEELAHHHYATSVAAQDAGDSALAARHKALLRVHDRGTYEPFLHNTGAITLHTDVDDLLVEASVLQANNRRLTPGPPVVLGRTPLTNVVVPAGSLLLTITTPTGAPVQLPLWIPAGERVVHQAPGSTHPYRVRTRGMDILGADECLVPAGWFISGGDALAMDGLTRRRLWIDDFVVQANPVTNRQFLEFLNALVADGQLQRANELAPRRHGDQDSVTHAMRFDGERFVLAGLANDMLWDLDWPVTLVTPDAAEAYAEFVSTPDCRWRLPHDQEMEKATRGVDGRCFPWGNHFEPAWARVFQSAGSPPTPAVLALHPEDCSVYGVRHVAGNVRVWCANAYDQAGPQDGDRIRPDDSGGDEDYRSVRGGAWLNTPDLSRAASRFAGKRDGRYSGTGFRLVRSLHS